MSGNLFESRDQLLPETYSLYWYKLKCAREYWNYQEDGDLDSEFLLDGICKITKLIEEVNIDEKSGKVIIK